MQARRPSRVLATLNEAMLRAESRFCTVAYARLRIGAERIRATIACGGHPQPLLLKADGSVVRAGTAGTLLGAFPEPRLMDRTIDLVSGDTLVLFTDGVIEARCGDDILGEEGVLAVVATCAGKSAEEIAEAVETTALDCQDGVARDDIAVVVLKVR